MMSRALLVLSDQAEKAKAVAWINGAPVNTRVEFKRPKRSLDQNSKMWAMLTEVAQQVKWHGLTLHADDWKLIFLDALKREVRMVPNIDGNGFVSLGRSSSDLSKDEMSDLIELIFKFGAEHNIQFKESSAHPPADEGSDTAASSPSSVAATPSPAQAETSEAGSDNMGESETEPASNSDFNLMVECRDKFLQLATNMELPPEQRRHSLIATKDAWKDALPKRHSFVKQCFEAADRIIKGDQDATAVIHREAQEREFLSGLVERAKQ